MAGGIMLAVFICIGIGYMYQKKRIPKEQDQEVDVLPELGICDMSFCREIGENG
jgi:hypothetical protein